MKQVNLTRKKFQRGDEEMCDPRAGEGEVTNDVKKGEEKKTAHRIRETPARCFFPAQQKQERDPFTDLRRLQQF